MQDDPTLRSELATVPDPMIVPAPSGRVLAACAIKRGKSNAISLRALGRPKSVPFNVVSSGRSIEPPFQAAPISSGVTATGENAVQALLWKKPKPLASSAGIRLRRLTSL